ncbi:MAG: hypothetical protein ACLFVK_06610 [Dehalococcoidia bacterium]
MYRVRNREEATQVSPDGLAAAAAGLINWVNIQRLGTAGYTLVDCFWLLFDELVDTQKAVARSHGRSQEIERCRQLWLAEQRKLSTVSSRVYNVLGHAYNTGVLTKPLEELSDIELLDVKGIGIVALAEIRDAVGEGEECRVTGRQSSSTRC